MSAQWAESKSEYFSVFNNVKQGAICGSVLFCVCTDVLLNADTGCYIGDIYVGSMVYANDLTLLASNASAKRIMLDFGSQIATEYSVSFNASESKGIFFKAESHVAR